MKVTEKVIETATAKEKVLEISETEFRDIAIKCAKKSLDEDVESGSILVAALCPMIYASFIAELHSKLFNKEE